MFERCMSEWDRKRLFSLIFVLLRWKMRARKAFISLFDCDNDNMTEDEAKTSQLWVTLSHSIPQFWRSSEEFNFHLKCAVPTTDGYEKWPKKAALQIAFKVVTSIFENNLWRFWDTHRPSTIQLIATGAVWVACVRAPHCIFWCGRSKWEN